MKSQAVVVPFYLIFVSLSRSSLKVGHDWEIVGHDFFKNCTISFIQNAQESPSLNNEQGRLGKKMRYSFWIEAYVNKATNKT